MDQFMLWHETPCPRVVLATTFFEVEQLRSIYEPWLSDKAIAWMPETRLAYIEVAGGRHPSSCCTGLSQDPCS